MRRQSQNQTIKLYFSDLKRSRAEIRATRWEMSSPAPSSPSPPVLVLEIHTHAHAPPLRPQPDISFDLRRLQNPPKVIRDRYDGRSRRLREHLQREPGFVERLEGAMAEIIKAVEEGKGRIVEVGELGGEEVDEGEEDGEEEGNGSDDGDDQDDDADDDDDDDEVTLDGEGVDDDDESPDDGGTEDIRDSSVTKATILRNANSSTSTSPPDSGAPSAGPSLALETPTRPAAAAVEATETLEQGKTPHELPLSSSRHHSEDPATALHPSAPATTRILRVSCFCARGRHRSVAFAEELARWRRPDGTGWPVGWEVRVVHRDVDGGSRKRAKGGGGGRGGKRGGGESQGRGGRWRGGMDDDEG